MDVAHPVVLVLLDAFGHDLLAHEVSRDDQGHHGRADVALVEQGLVELLVELSAYGVVEFDLAKHLQVLDELANLVVHVHRFGLHGELVQLLVEDDSEQFDVSLEFVGVDQLQLFLILGVGLHVGNLVGYRLLPVLLLEVFEGVQTESEQFVFLIGEGAHEPFVGDFSQTLVQLEGVEGFVLTRLIDGLLEGHALFVVALVKRRVFLQVVAVSVLHLGEIVVGVFVQPGLQFREDFVVGEAVVIPVADQGLVQHEVVLGVDLHFEDLAPRLDADLLDVHTVAHVFDEVEVFVYVFIDDYEGGGGNQGLDQVGRVEHVGVALVGLVALQVLVQIEQCIGQHLAAGLADGRGGIEQVELGVLVSHGVRVYNSE